MLEGFCHIEYHKLKILQFCFHRIAIDKKILYNFLQINMHCIATLYESQAIQRIFYSRERVALTYSLIFQMIIILLCQVLQKPS